MKLKRFILAFLLFFLLITACSASSPTSSLPTPVVKFPFDVSKRNNTVNQEIRIRDYRSYYFALRFDYFGHSEEQRVLEQLLGIEGLHKYPGINIPIHIKISKLDTGTLPPELIYENTIVTKYCYASGYERNQTDGNHLRMIREVTLKRGIYRVEANTIEDRPEFSGTPSYLQIEWHPNTRIIPDSK